MNIKVNAHYLYKREDGVILEVRCLSDVVRRVGNILEVIGAHFEPIDDELPKHLKTCFHVFTKDYHRLKSKR